MACFQSNQTKQSKFPKKKEQEEKKRKKPYLVCSTAFGEEGWWFEGIQVLESNNM